MKTKLILLSVIFITFYSTPVFTQLKVDQFGRIGMGTNYPNPYYRCHIKGNLLLTTYPDAPPPNNVPIEFRFLVGNGSPGAEFGSNVGNIAVWYSGVGYNNLYAKALYTMSDTTHKRDLKPISNTLEKLLQINSYSFRYITEKENSKLTFGFSAQEVEKLFPNMTDTAKGTLLVDYQQFIPLIVESMKEQQLIIDSLKVNPTKMALNDMLSEKYDNLLDSLISEINELKEQLSYCCNKSHIAPSSSNPNSSTLYQNRPNPFSENTVIEYEITEISNTASIVIFDMQGLLIKKFQINEKGRGLLQINGFDLKAGMYLYTLIVDEHEVDTKRMILID